MKFRTEINTDPSSYRLNHKDKMLFIGSCFTDNIGKKLEELRFPVVLNPFGVVYNPLSVKRSLEILLERKKYDEGDLYFHNNMWFSWDHHSSFSHPEKKQVLEKINREIHRSSEHLEEARYLLITFGTARVYKLRENNRLVCNCHKVPASSFNRELLDADVIAGEYAGLFQKLKKFNPRLKYIFTISPVRHWKDGAHGNQVSKSVLHLAIEKITKILKEDVEYFPAYELMLDDLRDYRFYASDMLHPAPPAIDYIWEKFSATYFSPETRSLNSRLEKILRAAEHRVSFPGSEAHRKFAEKQLKDIDQLKKEFPFLDLGELRKPFIF